MTVGSETLAELVEVKTVGVVEVQAGALTGEPTEVETVVQTVVLTGNLLVEMAVIH